MSDPINHLLPSVSHLIHHLQSRRIYSLTSGCDADVSAQLRFGFLEKSKHSSINFDPCRSCQADWWRAMQHCASASASVCITSRVGVFVGNCADNRPLPLLNPSTAPLPPLNPPAGFKRGTCNSAGRAPGLKPCPLQCFRQSQPHA
jgi:hypothetical protein